ncbi:MAG: aminotransferase class I/II-fold pyridoxal phosphate-dependent enzyme, partial [Halocynthiibacter sp.]
MTGQFIDHLSKTLSGIEADGLTKHERQITAPQGARISVSHAGQNHENIINLCANNYLGLANHPALIRAATDSFESHGYGMASVRFICGTQDIHRQLEAAIAAFLG